MDIGDDWLFDSIKNYHGLYMYNLQKPVQAADWAGSDVLLVSVTDDKRHELLELSLPGQLCQEEDSGASKDRDFTVLTGGFSDSCLVSLCHLKNSRRVVACVRGDNSVETWQLQTGDQNLVERIGVINNKVCTCLPSETCVTGSSHLVFGSHLDSVCVADLASQTLVSCLTGCETASRVSNMIPQESSVLTSDRTTGQLHLLDPRTSAIQAVAGTQCQDMSQPGGGVNDTWVLCQMTSGSDSVIQMSSSGTVCVRDSRNLKHSVKMVETEIRASDDAPVISVCPNNPDLLAVTGCGGHVHIYDRSKWEDRSKVMPVFVHKGHVAEIDDPNMNILTSTHLWYPWKRDTLLSASRDGGLHIFQPKLS